MPAAKLLPLALTLAALGCGGGAVVGSVGVVFGRDGDTRALYVREVPAGLAAESAGLAPGDQVVMIEGRYVGELDAKQIRALLRGDIGSTVDVAVVRGAEVHLLRLTRTGLRPPAPRPPREERLAL